MRTIKCNRVIFGILLSLILHGLFYIYVYVSVCIYIYIHFKLTCNLK